MKKALLLLAGIFLVWLYAYPQPQLEIEKTDDTYRVLIRESGTILMESEPTGLWSVATDWSDNWPDQWINIPADSLERMNAYTILHGSYSFPSGLLKVRDAYTTENNLIKCTRRWEWTGKDTLKTISLSIRFLSPDINDRVLIPGVLYYGNPAGARSGRTPVLRGTAGELALFEEHRLPMPFVSREWTSADQTNTAILHSLPSPVPFGNKTDQWWSVGVVHENTHTVMSILSGPVAFNRQKSVIKAFQGPDMIENYDEAWMNLPPGTIIEKTFYLQGQAAITPGSGFQPAVESALTLFQPWELTTLPSYDAILQAKITFAQSRYQEGENYAGFRKYPDRPFFVLGWCGQAMAPGYALQILGQKYPEAQQPDQIQRSLDFLSSTNFYDSGFYTWYAIDKEEWFMSHTPEWLSQGQAMGNMANAILAAENSTLNTTRWMHFLQKAADFHASRILSNTWSPESTNEGFFIAPLVLCHKIFSTDAYLQAAKKAAGYYADRYLNMHEVYWGGTLDASCEDKEGAFAALQGFIELHAHTGDEQYLTWAKHAGDICLTYTVVWDIPLPPGRLTDHQFKTRGWTAVSVQNMHIDVYGVLIAPYIYRLGQAINNDEYQKIAELMFRSCGQLIDPYGSQGEQPYQTNYVQTAWQNKPVYERRGNYLETWTVFWITAHFLNAGAMFMELGVI